MLVREGEARTHGIDRRLAVTLAGIAGALNAAAFHAAGFFAANMTGNASLVSDRLATGHLALAAFLIAVIAAFIAGSAIATILVEAMKRRGITGAYARCILVEAGLLAGLGLADFLTAGEVRVHVLVLGLSFLMGMQNAVSTRISNARVRTTHVSGTLTDIGIEIATLGYARRWPGRIADDQIRSRLALHVATVVAFCVGGVIGVVAHDAIGGTLLLALACTLAIVAMPAAFGWKQFFD